MMSDKSPLVEITVHATDILFTNCDYPEPTKEMIIEKMRELLDEGNISYSEKRHPQTTITSAIEKINKDHEKFQYNNRAEGPSNIFKGLQQVERTCYDLIREIEQGKWDGKVDLED